MPIITISGITRRLGKKFFHDVLIAKLVPIISCRSEDFNLITNKNAILALRPKIIVEIIWLPRSQEIKKIVVEKITTHFKKRSSKINVYVIFNEMEHQIYLNGERR